MNKSPLISITVVLAFLSNSVLTGPAWSQDFVLPQPGAMIEMSPAYDPAMLKGMKVYDGNPFKFDFILDRGDSRIPDGQMKEESNKLIKYFLASLTVPEKELWVNLSPYEKDRIVPTAFGQTEMGRDLLAQDYILKQLTATLIYPENAVGKKFWDRVYHEAARRFGTTDIKVNTYNKVWIVPEKAVVYENAKAGTVYIVDSRMKVMLDQDYLALQKNTATDRDGHSLLANRIIREIVIPELDKEVNEDANFATLRQVYNSLILATWYKKKVRDSILAQVYEDKNKILGINIDDPKEKERIYRQYLEAFKKGVYNYIKEDISPVNQELIPRKYFSGGWEATHMDTELQYATKAMIAAPSKSPWRKAHLLMVSAVMSAALALPVAAMAQNQPSQMMTGGALDQPLYNFTSSVTSTTSHGVTTVSVQDPGGPTFQAIDSYEPVLFRSSTGAEYYLQSPYLLAQLNNQGVLTLPTGPVNFDLELLAKNDPNATYSFRYASIPIGKEQFYYDASANLGFIQEKDGAYRGINGGQYVLTFNAASPVVGGTTFTPLKKFYPTTTFTFQTIPSFSTQTPGQITWSFGDGPLGVLFNGSTPGTGVAPSGTVAYPTTVKGPGGIKFSAVITGNAFTGVSVKLTPEKQQHPVDLTYHHQPGEGGPLGHREPRFPRSPTPTPMPPVNLTYRAPSGHHGLSTGAKIGAAVTGVVGAEELANVTIDSNGNKHFNGIIAKGIKALLGVDNAMQAPGGIDFNTNKLNLELRNAGNEIRFHVNSAMLAQLRNVRGFTSVVIGIEPMTEKMLSQFLGI